MKKKFLILSLIFLLSPSPVSALSWSDIFPAINVKKSSRDVPGTAKSQEVKTEDTFSNTLQNNRLECRWRTWFGRTWLPDYQTQDNWVRVGTTPEGDAIMENQPVTVNVPYPAKDITKTDNYDKMANNFTRVYQTVTAYGAVKCQYDPKDFRSMSFDGKNSILKGQDSLSLYRLRSDLLVNAVLSLDQDDPKDVADQDIHELWVCPGGCKELSSKDTADCRPVKISEIVYAAIKQGGIFYPNRYNTDTGTTGVTEKIYYAPDAREGADFPGDITSIVQKYYEGKGKNTYYDKFKKDFSLQNKEFYRNFYEQLNAFPKGNINTKVTNVGYKDINYTSPAPTPYDRTIPAGVAAASLQGTSLDKFMPANHKDLPNTDPCDGPVTGSQGVIDRPTPLNIYRFVLGIFATVYENIVSREVYNDVGVTFPATTVENTKKFEDLSAYLVPKTIQEKNKFVSQPFGSRVADGYPVDLGTRGANFYTEGANVMLLPKSWAKNVRNQTANDPNDPAAGTGIPDATLQSFCGYIQQASAATGLEPSLIAAIITVESSGNPNAISNQGAVGLMQVMPSDGVTAELFPGYFSDRPTTAELLNPEFNIQYGSMLLAQFIQYWGSERDGILHYGPTGIGYDYADKVLGVKNANPNACSGEGEVNL